MSAKVTKDPSARLDYSFDWSAWLGEDVIVSSEWRVPSGLTKEDENSSETATTAWLSGGTAGETYAVSNRITTAAGRIDERSIVVKVKER